jgi:hypothetical protein
MAKLTRFQRKRVIDLLEPFSARVEAAFLAAIDNLTMHVDVKSLIAALEAGNIDNALTAVKVDKAIFSAMDRELYNAYHEAGEMAASTAQTGGRLTVRFDGQNAVALAWLREYSSDLVTGITNDQREMIRNHLQATLMDGANPREAARSLVGRYDRATRARTGGVLGLTDNQALFVRNATKELSSGSTADLRAYLNREARDKRYDRSVLRAIRDSTTLPSDTQLRMIQGYNSKLLKLRGETIGLTETMTALHAAQYETYRQLVEDGSLRPEQIRRIWRTASDWRVRDSHRPMEAQSVSMDEPFKSGRGVQLLYPGDRKAPAVERIRCRCNVDYRIDFLSNI